ncbi:MAG: hypothetical protein J0J05_12275 [Microbacterium sp.]|uniref:DUF6338 family protein n=1 Tax=Microbacterium sp. TaxID=51671 RepID=UPI001AD023B7|nr:DUF6338 family protein [Microbacterium sp.]MBN9154748.1 hypothetical protein [Microbacterium sp.]
MNLPESLPQVLIYIAMLVPGFSYVTVRTWYVGWRSPDYGAGSRILETIYVSAIFAIVYVSLGLLGFGLASGVTGMNDLGSFATWIDHGWESTPAWWIGLVALVLLVLIPGGTSALMNWRTKVVSVEEDGSLTTTKKPVNRNQATPRAWDHAAYGAASPRWVRIKTSTDVYVGGWLDGAGYISTYPYDRDIFISHQWRMSKRGDFLEPIENSLGVWVPITDACHVEWIDEKPAAETG